MTTRKCSKCEKRKSKAEFHRSFSRSAGVAGHCKACAKEEVKQWRLRKAKENPAALARRKWSHRIKNKYGITVEDYDRILAAQGGGCKICGHQDSGGAGSKLVIDHDHKTGEVRGILCSPCNVLLGFAKDSPDILKSAIGYLDSFEGLQVTDRYAKSLSG